MSFSFGAPSSAPATNLSGSFSFGANKPATPAFGLGSSPATGAPTFGASTPAFGAGGGAFGAPSATPAFGASTPSFGATSAAPTLGGTSAAPTFGAASAAPTFGATSTAPTFGAASAAPAFGTTTTPAFGATTTPAFGATTTPAFGATITPAFGTTSNPGFGGTKPTFGLGTGGLNFGAGTSTAAPTTGLSFGTTTTSATTGLGGLGGFGFGTATTAQSTGLGLWGGTSTATTASGLLGGVKLGTSLPGGLSTTVTPSLGLGGVAVSTGLATNTTASDGKSEPPKQTKLPNEISTTVDSFKEFVKKQKSLSSDIMRASVKPMHKVSRAAEATLRLAGALRGELWRARAGSRRLRTAAAAALAAADTAARDSPEMESPAPPAYVKELIAELEQQLITFRRQMDVADKQIQASPKLLTEQELTLGIRRMHESLVALAGRLQAVHTQVEAQKEQYINLRKYVLKDHTNVFETPATTSLDQILREAEGSRKKAKSGHFGDNSFGSAVLADPRAALGNIQQLAGPTPFTYIGGSYPNHDSSGTNWQPPAPANTLNTSLNLSFGAPAADTSAFQLQKPPGKRGKQ